MTTAQKIAIGVIIVAIIALIILFMMSGGSSAQPASNDPVTGLPIVGSQPSSNSSVGDGSTAGSSGNLPPGLTAAVKTLYSSYLGDPGRYLVGWNPFSSGIKQQVKVLTEPAAGTTKYVACKSNDAPDRHLFHPNDCPAGWTPDLTFYTYNSPAVGTVPLCFGSATGPVRGKIGIGESNCGNFGWTHDALTYVPA